MTPHEYGLYGLSLVIVALVANSSFDGFGLAFSRLARRPTRPSPCGTISTVAVLFVLVAVLNLFVALLLLGSGVTREFNQTVLIFGIASAICYSAFELAVRFEVINQRPERFLLMHLIRATVAFLCSVAAAWFTGDAIWVIVGAAAGFVAGTVAGTVPYHQIGLVYFDRDLASRLLAIAFPMALCMMIDGATLTGARAMVQALGSIESLGQFTVAYLMVQSTLCSETGSGIGAAGYQLAIKDFEAGDKLKWRHQMLENAAVLFAWLAPAAVGLMITSSNIARPSWARRSHWRSRRSYPG